MTGIFLSVSRVLPDDYPLVGELDDYIAGEHTIGRLLDLGVIVPGVFTAAGFRCRVFPTRPAEDRHPRRAR